MDRNPSQILETALQKAKENTQFTRDLTKYAKYLAIKHCPEDRLPELEAVFKYGDLEDFFGLGSQFVPDFGKKIIDYTEEY